MTHNKCIIHHSLGGKGAIVTTEPESTIMDRYIHWLGLPGDGVHDQDQTTTTTTTCWIRKRAFLDYERQLSVIGR